METVTKKAKSLKNAEKRRERSKVAARCRRGKESEIFTDLSLSLPIPENVRTGLDKASIMRLTLCDLKIKTMMEAVLPANTNIGGGDFIEEFDSQLNSAMGGFILATNLDGDVIYASEGITTHLGICQYEIMGQSIFEFSHPCDHSDIRELMACKKGDEDVIQRSGLFRMKSTVTARGRNAHLRSGTFKVINCIGRIFTGNENDASEKWFVSVCEPLLHPSDVEIPLNKQTFLSKHTPDMKFEYVDESISTCMGYKPTDLLGKSIFDFHHATDGDGFVKSFKSLYSKGQNQTDRYRFLTKGGGWVWIVTQATVIYGNNSSTPNSVVCIHFITSGREGNGHILSNVQMDEESLSPILSTSVVVPISKSILSENTINIPASKECLKSSEVEIDCMMDVDDLIVDIPSQPSWDENATCNTNAIFSPRTNTMLSPFLLPLEDTLIVLEDEPNELTKLAPIAGDGLVSLDIPLLEDLIATLNAADLEYSFLDPESDEIPLYDDFGYSQSDPTMMDSAASNSPLFSSYSDFASDSLASGGFLSSSELGCSLSTKRMDEEIYSVCSADNIHLNSLSEQTLNTFAPYFEGSNSSKMAKVVPLCSATLVNKIQGSDVSGSLSKPQRLFLLVPVTQRRASMRSSSSSSDNEYTSFGRINESYDSQKFNSILKSFGLRVDKGCGFITSADFSKARVVGSSKRFGKINQTGSLLSNEPRSFLELTRQDCEVNAPLSAAVELLQGNELLTALEVPMDV